MPFIWRRATAIGAAALYGVSHASHSPAHLSSTGTSADDEPIGLGIVGTGWGVQIQAPAFRAAGFRIAAIYSRSLDRAKALAKEHLLGEGYASVRELCADAKVHLVSVVGPASERRWQTLAALEAGKHVLADKPFALDESEAMEMLTAARERPSQLAVVDFELRMIPALQRVRQLLRSGELGEVESLSFRTALDWDRFRDTGIASHWTSAEAGGGVFGMAGTHHTDLVRFLTGREVAAVRATAQRLPTHLRVGDGSEVQARVTAESMVSATMMLTADAGKPQPVVNTFICARAAGYPFEATLLICCERGSVAFDHNTAIATVYRPGSAPEVLDADGDRNGFMYAWRGPGTAAIAECLSKAVAAKRTGVDPPPGTDLLADFSDGVMSARTCDAVRRSAALDGQWVKVDTSLP